MLQDPSSVVDHIFDNLPSRENLAYLSGDATCKPWSGTEGVFRVLLKIVFDWDNALFKESFGFGLTVFLPGEKEINGLDQTDRRFPSSPIVDVRTPDNP